MRTGRKDDGSEIPAILTTVKTLLKAKSLVYRDVAARLGTSETTVKRYMTGHGLTVETLERLCRLVDLRLSDVLEMAPHREEAPASGVREERPASCR